MKHLTLALILAAAPVFAQGVPGQHFVENWDLDGDGAVSVAEATERRGDVFLSFDQDDDGFLDAEEYKVFDQARANDMENEGGGHGQGNMKNAAEGMELAMNDVDGDGKVSRDEFLGQAKVWIAEMDLDEDGVITTQDFAMRRKMMGGGHGKGN
ncbi:calcium-binding protein [Tropicibacter naphthalenivorans]|uniref:Transaldolase/EF-hand domain-containing protein n=1 Tax=Tropicibacter naphthalenivorans TaxID=441103 RepID=A0A0P1GA85_9RHOB|nr:calcium-binding protein [Tropicibacter naphthalenivorans]CUH78254.1 transaldolase/EF-hand domain-containing protein [Tropicibacter naphthalenivorans]SMC78712.1 EF hand [Tropicibacter naphthalenivorans]